MVDWFIKAKWACQPNNMSTPKAAGSARAKATVCVIMRSAADQPDGHGQIMVHQPLMLPTAKYFPSRCLGGQVSPGVQSCNEQVNQVERVNPAYWLMPVDKPCQSGEDAHVFDSIPDDHLLLAGLNRMDSVGPYEPHSVNQGRADICVMGLHSCAGINNMSPRTAWSIGIRLLT